MIDKDEMLPLLFTYSMSELLGAAERQRDFDWERVKKSVEILIAFVNGGFLSSDGILRSTWDLQLMAVAALAELGVMEKHETKT